MSDLAARVVAAVGAEERRQGVPGDRVLRVTVEPGSDPALDAAMTEQLVARGAQIVRRADDVPSVRVQCLNNLRERVCSAELTGPIRNTILLTYAQDAVAPQPDVRLVLQLRPVISHEGPILDIARTADDLLVLTPTEIVRYENRQDRWQQIGTRAITAARPWPRDVRGRLHVAGTGLEAFLPGTTCTGSVDAQVMNCIDSTRPWPIDIEGSLAEARNYFATPEGLTFFGIARLGADAGASWLAATLDHRLAFVGEARRFESTGEAATDVAGIHVPCASTSHVLASTADAADERLVVLRVVRRQLLPAADPVVLPGRLTALWPTAAGERATVVTRDRDARRYVAHELAVSCAP